jgi:sec-independent protein translocase protein TatA
MGEFSPMHVLIVLVVAILLFGNRVPSVARSLGQGWSEFKKGVRGEDDDEGKGPPALTKQD